MIYEVVGSISTSKPLVQQCQHLVETLRLSLGNEDQSSLWVADNGMKIYGDVVKVNYSTINNSFLDDLRNQSFIFSGWHLSDLSRGEHTPSWTDALAAVFQEETELDWSIPAFKSYIKGLPNEYICNAPLVAGEYGFLVDGNIVNRDIVAYQERIVALYHLGILDRLKALDKPVICEIGAGYGALAYFLKKIIPHATYIIIDLPLSLLFSGCYLTLTQISEVSAPSLNNASPANLSEQSIFLVANHNLSKLKEVKLDLAINTLSFGEMPTQTVADYAEFISGALSSNGILFEQNFDNTHLHINTFCDPRIPLEMFFEHPVIPQGRYFWGTPKAWYPKNPETSPG